LRPARPRATLDGLTDPARPLEHARAVAREARLAGLLDDRMAAGLLRAYEAYLAQGVRGTFTQLLVSRGVIGRAAAALLEVRFPADSAFGDDEPAQPPTAPSETTQRLRAIRDLDGMARPEAGAAVAGDAPDALAWLECEPLAPIPLRPGEELRIGRDRGCHMVLPHQGVSRVHTVVRAGGDRMLVEDHSTYGTFVNGEPTAGVERPLEVGDVLAVGPYVIVVRDSSPRDESADTLPFRIPGFPSESMHGKLDEVALGEVLQQIEFHDKTGTLRVRSGERRGLLTVEDGRPRRAELGGLEGSEAVFGLLGLREGEFSFVRKVEEGARNCRGTITGLLLEASRRADEVE